MVWPWSRKTKKEKPEIDGSSGQFGLEAVGESHYQPAIRRALRDAHLQAGRRMIRVRVEREPTNSYDPRAVRIISSSGETLGYLPRERASTYQKVLKDFEKVGLTVTCAAALYGGDAKTPTLGVWLDLLFPGSLRAAMPPPRDH
jgi:hypothetical protein